MLFLSCICYVFACVWWSPAGKGQTSWLWFVMSNCVFVTFPCGILDQVWYLIVSIPDLCPLSYFKYQHLILGLDLFFKTSNSLFK